MITAKADVDQARARRAGVTSKDVADALEFFVDGATTTDYDQGNVQIPIVGRGIKAERYSPESLRTIGIRTSSGDSVPLNQVADVYTVGELDRIMRYNQERTITVSAKNQVLKASEIFAGVKPTLDGMEFPKNHYWHVGGELEDSAKAQKNLAKWLLPCFGGIVFLLVWQFNSIRRAGIIILTMPLVIVGTVVGLMVMQADFGFMVILGLLALAGSIVNNGIVMIDKIETNRREGQTPYDAVVNSAVSRFRPILLVGFNHHAWIPAADHQSGSAFLRHGIRHVLRFGHRQFIYAQLCPGPLQHLFPGESARQIVAGMSASRMFGENPSKTLQRKPP